MFHVMFCFVCHINYLSWFVKKPIKEAESNTFAPELINTYFPTLFLVHL